MIRLRHENLPAGLSALVRRSDGDLEVIVSTTLSAGRQRAAVRAGLRAMGPAERGAGPLPVPALIMIALAGTWLRAIGRLLRLHLAATTAVAGTVMAAAVVLAVAPHLHGPASPGRNPAVAASAPGATGGPTVPGFAAPSAVVQPVPSGMPVAARSPAEATSTPAASQPSPAASAPHPPPSAPTPAASGTGGSNGICLELLGIWVCL
jgi:hypothetical protein